MPAPKKIEQVAEIKKILEEKGNFVLTTYAGLKVDAISDVRREIRAQEGTLKVIKNNLFKIALQETGGYDEVLASLDSVLEGPLAATFSNGNFPAVSKLILKFSGEKDQIKIRAGCLEGKFLNEGQVKEVALLPSREEMLGIIGRGLNAPATKIATGMKEIITSLARGIKAIGEKNG